MEVNGVSQSEAAPYVTKSSVKFRDNFWVCVNLLYLVKQSYVNKIVAGI